MKRLLTRLSLLLVVLSLLLLGLAQFLLAPWLKSRITHDVNAKIQGSFTMDHLSLSFLPQPKVKLEGVHLKMDAPQLTAEVASLEIQTSVLRWLMGRPISLKATLTSPRIELLSLSTQSPAQPTEPGGALPARLPLTVEMDVWVKDALLSSRLEGSPPVDVTLSSLHLEGLDVRGPWSLELSSQIKRGVLTLPVQLSSVIAREESRFSTEQTRLDLAGLLLQIQGRADLNSGAHDWKAQIPEVDLSQLAALPQFLPPGKWSGTISGQLAAHKESGRTSWNATGHLSAQQLKGDVNWERPDLKLTGPMSAQAELDFSYADQLNMPRLLVEAQLQPLAIHYKDLLAKPAGVALALKLNGTVDKNILNLAALNFSFAQLQTLLKGSVPLSSSSSSQLHLTLPLTRLNGLEKYILPLSRSPLTGAVQLEAHADGPLSRPLEMSLRLQPLLLDRVQAHLQYEKDQLKLEGPVKAHAKINLQTRAREITQAQVNGEISASQLFIRMGELMDKPPGQPLELKLAAAQKGGRVELQNCTLLTTPGQLRLTGSVRNFQKPELNLKLQTGNLDFVSLSSLVPKLKSYKLDGWVAVDQQLSGTYDFKAGLERSPLQTRGSLKAYLKSYKLEKAETSKTPVKTVKEAVKPEPLLPPWPILRTAVVHQDFSVGRFYYDTLTIEGLRWQGQLNQGLLEGKARVDQIFGGEVDASTVSVSLLQAQPTTELKAEFKNFNLGAAVDWALPSWKDQIKGFGQGQVQTRIPYPTRLDLLEKLTAQGELKLEKGRLSAVRFEKMANEQLAKIPALSSSAKIRTEDVLADISTRFKLENKRMDLSNFQMITPDQDELRANGWLNLDKQVDLEGTAYLATAQVAGAIKEANSDAKGRLQIPIHIQGSLLSPQLSVATETITRMLNNTAKLQADKLKSNLQKQGADLIRKQGDKALDQLKGFLGK